MSFKKILTGFVTAAILIATMFGTTIPALAATDATSPAADESSSAPAAATGDPVIISVSDASVSPGNTIEVTMSMRGKNVAGFQGKLAYDEQALQVVNIEGTNILSPSGITMFHQDQNTEAFIDGNFVYASPVGADLDGIVLKFTFKASDDASGKYDFTLEELALFDEAAGALTPQIESDGSITVGAGGGGQRAAAGTSNFLIIIIIALSVVVIAVIVIVIVVLRKRKAKRSYYEAPAHYSGDE